jgi:hypothetical protein
MIQGYGLDSSGLGKAPVAVKTVVNLGFDKSGKSLDFLGDYWIQESLCIIVLG